MCIFSIYKSKIYIFIYIFLRISTIYIQHQNNLLIKPMRPLGKRANNFTKIILNSLTARRYIPPSPLQRDERTFSAASITEGIQTFVSQCINYSSIIKESFV